MLELRELEDGILLANLSGRLDMKSTLEINDAFTFKVAASRQNTVVDMSNVDFIASIGMRMLLSNAKALQKNQKHMFLVNPQAMVMDALKTAGIAELIPTYNTVEEAIAAFNH